MQPPQHRHEASINTSTPLIKKEEHVPAERDTWTATAVRITYNVFVCRLCEQMTAYARRVGVVASATGLVEHVLGDGRVKTWLALGIGELGGDDGVYVGRRAGFVLKSEVDECVHVGGPVFETAESKSGDMAVNFTTITQSNKKH
jgi:hypothetical protein